MWTNRNIERESVFAFQGPSAGSPSPTNGCVWRGTQLLLAYLTMLRYNIAPTIYPGVHTSSSCCLHDEVGFKTCKVGIAGALLFG